MGDGKQGQDDLLGLGRLSLEGGVFQNATEKSVTLGNAWTVNGNIAITSRQTLSITNEIQIQTNSEWYLTPTSHLHLLGDILRPGQLTLKGRGSVKLSTTNPSLLPTERVTIEVV